MAGNAQILVRSDTAANWSAVNPIMTAKEIGYDKTNLKFKVGDGVLAWNALPYVNPPTGLLTASGYTANTARLLGRITAGTGAVEELTAAQARTLLALGTAALLNISVGTVAPASPAVNDLWVDTN